MQYLHIHLVSVLITFINIRLPVPSLVTYNKTSYKAEDEVLHESDIGPEVTHIYQVRSTSGATDSPSSICS